MKNICIERELWDHVREREPEDRSEGGGKTTGGGKGKGEAGFLRWQELRER